MVVGKHEIEAALHAEKQAINAGQLKEDSPLDISEDFRLLCEACRRGDLKACQEKIQEGVQINARDQFDYTPLNLASLCGHYEVVQLLLESGALCERDTFEGERCMYNALTDRIRNLLQSYDYSKSRDPLQPLASHVSSLLHRDVPATSDITIKTDTRNFDLHKFILSARSPFFAKKLADAPQTTSWKVSSSIPSRSMEIAIMALYFGEVNYDFSASEDDQAVLRGIEKLSQQLEVGHIYDAALEMDRRVARQRRSDEIQRGRDQLEAWFSRYILGNCVEVDREKADNVQWDRQNSLFADVLLCAVDSDETNDDDDDDDDDAGDENGHQRSEKKEGMMGTNDSANLQVPTAAGSQGGGRIPVGSFDQSSSSSPSVASRSTSRSRAGEHQAPGQHHYTRAKQKPTKLATLFPVHRAMLIRSEYFLAMFSSPFREAQPSEHLPIVHTEYSPVVLRVILAYLYTESMSFGLGVAVDVLFAADQLFMDKLKNKAAVVISTLGNGRSSVVEADNSRGVTAAAAAAAAPPEAAGLGDEATGEEDEELDIYDVIRAGWDTRMRRLEEFGARYIAYRLERFVEEPEFKVLVQESAARILDRQETDTIELIDDIRYYLDERFRLRFEDVGMEEILEEEEEQQHTAEGKAAAAGSTASGANAADAENEQRGVRAGQDKEGKEGTDDNNDDEDEEEDQFDQDTLQYELLLGKIGVLLEELNLSC